MNRLLVALLLFAAACTPVPPDGVTPPASVDTATELNSFMAQNAGKTIDLGGRTVRINDGTVQPPARTTLQNGRLERTADSRNKSFRHVRVTAPDVTLSGIVIVGDAEIGRRGETLNEFFGGQPYMIYNPWREGQHGISLEGAVRTTLRAVNIRNVWGDGIYMAGDVRDLDAQGVIIYASGRGGLVATDAERVNVDNIHIDRVGLWLINLEPHGAGRTVRDFVVTRHASDRGGRSSYWLNASGPTRDSLPFDCGMTASIDRPTGLTSSHFRGVRLHNCLPPGTITLTGNY